MILSEDVYVFGSELCYKFDFFRWIYINVIVRCLSILFCLNFLYNGDDKELMVNVLVWGVYFVKMYVLLLMML